ncbi:metal transporter [Halalkalibacillus sediminis]|uniref:Metal transporter n=1 Tax=Halalkalibacillus sediminis TaxID=2018042 RepID=A0A2I0QTF9_9BACI|nr:ion channel [Halalkalibacillus sediminis]PKR77621.1 metal transporter [Halalkalibacillus sediminis]
MSTFLIVLAVIFFVVNLYYFFTNKSYKYSYFSSVLFFKLFVVLLGITISFGLLYYALSLNHVVLNNTSGNPVNVTFWNAMYFSGETILSVGYGDLVPVGSARFFALLEAACGLLLPTAYFIKALDGSRKNKNEDNYH